MIPQPMTPATETFHPAPRHTDGVLVEGTGPPLVLAHGAGGGVALNFRPLVDALRDGRTLVGRDYPGSGERPRQPEPLILDVLADELVTTAVEAGLDRFPVVGLSLGTAVAVTAALRHPEHVTGLYLTVGFARPDAQMRIFARVWQELARLEAWDALGHHLLEHCVSADALGALPIEQVAAAAQEARSGYPAGGAEQVELAVHSDLSTRLGDIRVPTAVLVAEQDRVVMPATTRELGRLIPRAEVSELAGAGHIFDAAQTVDWIGRIGVFLAAHRL